MVTGLFFYSPSTRLNLSFCSEVLRYFSSLSRRESAPRVFWKRGVGFVCSWWQRRALVFHARGSQLRESWEMPPLEGKLGRKSWACVSASAALGQKCCKQLVPRALWCLFSFFPAECISVWREDEKAEPWEGHRECSLSKQETELNPRHTTPILNCYGDGEEKKKKKEVFAQKTPRDNVICQEGMLHETAFSVQVK